MTLLWLPYIIWSVILVSLLAASFIRFHLKNRDVYRRRVELARRLVAFDSWQLTCPSTEKRVRRTTRMCMPGCKVDVGKLLAGIRNNMQVVNEEDDMTDMPQQMNQLAWLGDEDEYDHNTIFAPTSARSKPGGSPLPDIDAEVGNRKKAMQRIPTIDVPQMSSLPVSNVTSQAHRSLYCNLNELVQGEQGNNHGKWKGVNVVIEASSNLLPKVVC